ncbi:MAG: hypothetical protein ACD_10C00479G0011 [uncultured bacterium]|nr:MAG: hypothetical protein ACD_10C00479G0011 [uncultured bacterium]
MSAIVDNALIHSPLAQLPAAELPLAVMLRRRAGGFDNAEVTHAAIHGMVWFIERQDGRGLVAFINAMAESSSPDKSMSALAAEVGTIPNLADNTDRLIVVLGEDGDPVTDREGRLMMFSIRALKRMAEERQCAISVPRMASADLQ